MTEAIAPTDSFERPQDNKGRAARGREGCGLRQEEATGRRRGPGCLRAAERSRTRPVTRSSARGPSQAVVSSVAPRAVQAGLTPLSV